MQEASTEPEYDEVLLANLKEAAHSSHEFHEALYGEDFDCREAFWSAGEVVHHRCIYHWLGLRMAVEQLKEKTAVLKGIADDI